MQCDIDQRAQNLLTINVFVGGLLLVPNRRSPRFMPHLSRGNITPQFLPGLQLSLVKHCFRQQSLVKSKMALSHVIAAYREHPVAKSAPRQAQAVSARDSRPGIKELYHVDS